MQQPLNERFIAEINDNMGIIIKVCRIYFQNTDEREDVKQEMLYQLWKAYPGFKGTAKFSTWMYRVCLNTAIKYLRKILRTKHEDISAQHHEIAEQSGRPHDENKELLHNGIEKLSTINKAIILLYLENHSYEEIALVTGLSKVNISVRLVRIKKELEKELKKNLNTLKDISHG